MLGSPRLQASTCKMASSSLIIVHPFGNQYFVPYLTNRTPRVGCIRASSENSGQTPVPLAEKKNPLTVVLDVPSSIWRQTLRPLSDFGFGKKSIWEGGVGLFIVSGAVLLTLALAWLRAFHLKSQFKKYQTVFEFSQACGICMGTPVRIRGVTVGTVVRIIPSLKSIEAVAEVEDDKVIIPRNSLIEVNQSGLLMETLIDITPQDPLPTPSAGPLDPECAKEGLIVCDRQKITGQQGTSLDELVGIFTRLGRDMEEIGVSKSYTLAEKVATVIEESKPLLAKIEAMAEDIQPLLSEARTSGLLKEVESLTKSLTEATEDLRRVNSSILTPENTKQIRQSISTLLLTLKNIESISSDVSGFTGDEVTRQNLKLLITKKIKMQEAFQPGSTPVQAGKRHFLCYNMLGSITTIENEGYSHIEVDFHDTGRGPRVPSMTDYFGFTMASLNETGSVFGNPSKGEKNMSTLMYRPFGSWANNSEWSMRFEAEEVKAVALGIGWIAAVTSLNYVRIFTEGGLQRHILSLDGPVVTASGSKNELAVVIHASDCLSSGDQVLEFKVFNIANGTQPISGRLPLTPGSCLSWFGFSEDGQLSSYDSKGVLRVFTNQYGGSWLPVFSASKERKSEEESYWVVGLNASKLFCIVCKSPDSYPPVTPKPVLTLLSLSFPIASSDLGADSLENEFMMINLHLSQTQKKLEEMEASGMDATELDDEAFNLEAALDRCILRLIAGCCNGDKLVRAMELARLLSLEKSLKGAIKLVTALKLPMLAERFNGILEERLLGYMGRPASASNTSTRSVPHSCPPAAEDHKQSGPSTPLIQPRLPASQFSKHETLDDRLINKSGGNENDKNAGPPNAKGGSHGIQFHLPADSISKVHKNSEKSNDKAKAGDAKEVNRTANIEGSTKQDKKAQFQRPTNPFVKASTNQEKSSLFDSLKKLKQVDGDKGGTKRK